MAHSKTKIAITSTCLAIVVGVVAIQLKSPRKALRSGAAELELGNGMGSNLMTPQFTASSQESFEDLIARIGDSGSTMELLGTTSEFRSVLIAGEGSKFYVREGDGEWTQVEEQEESHSSDPFSEEGNPFDEGTADPFGNSAER